MDKKFEELLDSYLKITKKEGYAIEAMDGNPTITDDKIGGIPYLPIGESIPLDNEGNEMELLLQVDLSDVELSNFNINGILQVYIEQDLPYPITYKIKVQKPNLPYQEDLELNVANESPIEEPFKIKLKKVDTYMSLGDFRAEKIILDLVEKIYGYKGTSMYNLEDESLPDMEEMWELLASINPSANIGGHPDFTQNDPRQYDEHKEKTECLFKIDSDINSSKIMIGDLGIIFGLISEEDLKNNNLDNTLVDWDCC